MDRERAHEQRLGGIQLAEVRREVAAELARDRDARVGGAERVLIDRERALEQRLGCGERAAFLVEPCEAAARARDRRVLRTELGLAWRCRGVACSDGSVATTHT